MGAVRFTREERRLGARRIASREDKKTLRLRSITNTKYKKDSGSEEHQQSEEKRKSSERRLVQRCLGRTWLASYIPLSGSDLEVLVCCVCDSQTEHHGGPRQTRGERKKPVLCSEASGGRGDM